MQMGLWAGALVLGALLLVLFRRRRHVPGKIAQKATRQIVVDGTNVLFWRDNMAQLNTLKAVLKRLRRDGFDPVVYLDASSRHHLGDPTLGPRQFQQALGLATDQVFVVPARTEADSAILAHARRHNLAVVSNDRFRDRPQQARNVRLIKGRFDGARLVLKNL